MKKEIQFIANVYLNKRIDIDRKIEILGEHLFRFSRKEVSVDYKYAKAVSWFSYLNDLLFMPAFDVTESKYYNPDFLGQVTSYDFNLLNEVGDYINKLYKDYKESEYVYSKYHDVFREWANNIHPSHNNKGSWTHSAIDKAQQVINRLKEENSKLHEVVRDACLKNNTSENLIMLICFRLLYLKKVEDGVYQFNPKNEEILEVMHEYYSILNIKPYADEYNKISLIRSILHTIIDFCFNKDFDIENEGYCMMKFHSRLLLKIKTKKQAFHDSKSINNHYITYNDSNNLLHKLSSSFYFIPLKYHNIHYDKDAFSAGVYDNDSS